MAEYIEREAALKEFEKVCNVCMALVNKPMCGDCSVADTVRKVKSIPAADVREVKWISVEERLPEDDETVLTWGDLQIVMMDWRHENKWCCFGDVTHWMPLPEPPKEG